MAAPPAIPAIYDFARDYAPQIDALRERMKADRDGIWHDPHISLN